jgi:hypothetical protein
MQPGGINEQQRSGGQARFERPGVQIVRGQQQGRHNTAAGQVPRAVAEQALGRCKASTCRCSQQVQVELQCK